MRVLFDITHPAQVHFFKHVIRSLKQSGHPVLVTTRDKDVTHKLLDALEISYTCLSPKRRGVLGLGTELIERFAAMYSVARRFAPDVMVARFGVSIGPAGALLSVPRIVCDENDYAHVQAMLGMPWATLICSGTGYSRKYGQRQVHYRGVPMLSYLAPTVFQPDAALLRRFGVEPTEPYIVLRTVAWEAMHDIGEKRASNREIRDLIATLSRHGRVLISSERPLPPELLRYQTPVPAAQMHHLLAFATLFIGESNTMAAEAAVLGTPAICCSPLHAGYALALERQYGLAYNVDSFEQGVRIAQELLAQIDLRAKWQTKRCAMLKESEDVNQFLVRLIAQLAAKGGAGA